MSILKVARMGHPVLRARARPVERTEFKAPAFQKFIDDLIETMTEYHGAGLAAPQVHEGVRVFVATIDDPPANSRDDSSDSPSDDKEAPEPAPIAIVNPEITVVGSDVVEDWEGCLSIPDIRGRVVRAREIKIRAFDRHGGRLDLNVQGFPARVIQHETDHLDGILFLDRMKSFETLTFLDEYSRYWLKD